MQFLRIAWWEFVQNLPLAAGFLLGLALWRQGRLTPALACMVIGSVLGAVTIWATESRIVKGHRESLRVVLANVTTLTVLMLVLAAYLTASWSRWWLDLVLGVVVGTVLGAAQDLAARSSIGVGHCLALGFSFALGLVGVRLLTTSLPLVWSIPIITAVVTVAIVAMDYGALWSGRSEAGPTS